MGLPTGCPRLARLRPRHRLLRHDRLPALVRPRHPPPPQPPPPRPLPRLRLRPAGRHRRPLPGMRRSVYRLYPLQRRAGSAGPLSVNPRAFAYRESVKRRHARLARKLASCAAAGALLTVAVAWGCTLALQGARAPVRPEKPRLPPGLPARWMHHLSGPTIASFFGARTTTWSGYRVEAFTGTLDRG